MDDAGAAGQDFGHADKFDLADLKRRMHGAVATLKHEFGGLRTGRASASLLDVSTPNAACVKASTPLMEPRLSAARLS